MKKKIKMALYILLGIIGFVLLFSVIYYNTSPQMGGKTIKYDSPNYKDGKFYNLVNTSIYSENTSIIRSTIRFFTDKSKEAFPDKPLPTKKVDLDLLNNIKSDEVSITWLGHSSVLIKSKDSAILADPVLNGKKMPPLFLGPKPFPYTNSNHIEDLPKIDVVLISHDHMDHLDMETVKKLKDSRFYVPLGIKSHLLRWGVDEENIDELDWYDEKKHKGIGLTLTPSRHFGGRGLFNKDSTLWGSWVIQIKDKTVYFGGDSGYFEEFKKIGKRYGPFDIAMLDTGQYHKDWQPVHLMPDEVIQATIDLDAKHVLPIHNSKYVLALHPWYEPLDRVTAEGVKRNVSVLTPQIGETLVLGKDTPKNKWWKADS